MSAIAMPPTVSFRDARLNELLALDPSDRPSKVTLGQAKAWEKRYPGQIKVVDGPPQAAIQFFGTMEEWQARASACPALRR